LPSSYHHYHHHQFIHYKAHNFTFIMPNPFFLLLVSCGRQKSVALRPPGKRLSVHLRPQWTSSCRPQRTTALAVQVGPKLPLPHAPPNPLYKLPSHMLMLKPQMPFHYHHHHPLMKLRLRFPINNQISIQTSPLYGLFHVIDISIRFHFL
jgi:hypothetical protein